MEPWSLKNKVAIITGGARGIGKAGALALAGAGANTVIVDLRYAEAQKTADEAQKLGPRSLAVETDITKNADVVRMVEEAISHFGKVDILVNNAGIVIEKPVLEATEEEWRAVLDTNLTGMFLCAKAVGKHMVDQGGGKIINISSSFGIKAAPNVASYCAAKGGVILLTKALAVEWGVYKINVNCIAPSHFYTDFTKDIFEDPKLLKVILRKIPLGRYAQPQEMGPLLVFLASSASDFMTGETVVIDGGLTVKI